MKREERKTNHKGKPMGKDWVMATKKLMKSRQREFYVV